MAAENGEIERRLWAVADQLRANSGLKPSEYSRPVLGLLFLRYADGRFATGREGASAAAGKPARRADAGRVQGARRHLSDAGSALLASPEAAGRREPRPGAEQRDGRYRAEQSGPRRRTAEELWRGRRRHSARAHQDPGPARHRRRRLREGLRIFHGLVRHAGDAEGRRVLHALLHRAADRRDHRALSRPHPRPGLRIGRHVRSFGRFRAGAQARAGKGAVDLRHREGVGDAAPRAHEPRRSWPRRHDPRGQFLLRGAVPDRRPVRFRHGQSAVQRRRS